MGPRSVPDASRKRGRPEPARGLRSLGEPGSPLVRSSRSLDRGWFGSLWRMWSDPFRLGTLTTAIADMEVRLAALEAEAPTTITFTALVKTDSTVELITNDHIDGIDHPSEGRFTVRLDWDATGSPRCTATVHAEGTQEANATVYGSGGQVYVATGTADGTDQDFPFVLTCVGTI